jgi:hypothetical protein
VTDDETVEVVTNSEKFAPLIALIFNLGRVAASWSHVEFGIDTIMRRAFDPPLNPEMFDAILSGVENRFDLALEVVSRCTKISTHHKAEFRRLWEKARKAKLERNNVIHSVAGGHEGRSLLMRWEKRRKKSLLEPRDLLPIAERFEALSARIMKLDDAIAEAWPDKSPE